MKSIPNPQSLSSQAAVTNFHHIIRLLQSHALLPPGFYFCATASVKDSKRHTTLSHVSIVKFLAPEIHVTCISTGVVDVFER